MSEREIDIYAYRTFGFNCLSQFQIRHGTEGNYIWLTIAYLYSDDSLDERFLNIPTAFMKIKHHNNIELYDMIKIVFDDIMQLCAHIVPYAIVIDRICGDVEKIEGIEIYDKLETGKTIQLTRENTKYITYDSYEFDSDDPCYHYEGEILEDGTFVHNYVAPP
jgi:hypothetical protein